MPKSDLLLLLICLLADQTRKGRIGTVPPIFPYCLLGLGLLEFELIERERSQLM